MRAINHAVTGAVIGLTIPTPAIALPLAFLSHYVCDAIPHSGEPGIDNSLLRSRRFAVTLALDAAACLLLVVLLAVSQPSNWLLAAVCAFLAAVPDVASLPGWLRARRGGTFEEKMGWYTRFAKRIQWFERPIGVVVEIVWFAAFVAILITYL